MDGDRVVLLDVSEALYEAAEKLPRGSAWIDAFCRIAEVIEGDVWSPPLSAQERLRRRGIQARARVTHGREACMSGQKEGHGGPRRSNRSEGPPGFREVSPPGASARPPGGAPTCA